MIEELLKIISKYFMRAISFNTKIGTEGFAGASNIFGKCHAQTFR